MGTIYTRSIPVEDYLYDGSYFGNPIYPDTYSSIAVGSEWGALQDSDDASYVPVFMENVDGTWNSVRDNILRVRFKPFALPEGSRVLEMGLKIRLRPMTSLHTIAGYERVSETPVFHGNDEADTNFIVYGDGTKEYITKAEYLLDPQAAEYQYMQYTVLPILTNPSFDDIVIMYEAGETYYIPPKHPSYGSYEAPGTEGALLFYVNKWNVFKANPDPSIVERDIQKSIVEGTIGAIIAPSTINDLSTYGNGDIIGFDVSSVHLEIKFQVNYFPPMIPRSKYESVPIVREDLTYSFTATGKVREGVGMVLSWGSNDFGTPCEARAVAVDRDTGQTTIGPVHNIYVPDGTVLDGHGYYQKPLALTDHVSLIVVPYNSTNQCPTWFAVKTDANLQLSTVASGYAGDISFDTIAICDPVIGRGVVLNDDSATGSINTWIVSDLYGDNVTTSTTTIASLPADTIDFLNAGHVVFNVDATNSLVVGASGRVLAIDWTAKTFTYVRNLLTNWSWDTTMGTICKGITPNTVDILYRSGSAYKLLAGANIDGSGYVGDYSIPALYYINWNDWLTFDLEALLPLETGGWVIMQPIQSVSSGASVNQKWNATLFINSSGSFINSTSMMRESSVTLGASYSDQFQSSWVDLGNGVALGSLASRVSESYLLGIEFLTDTRSDDLLYINAPDVPDPVYPDGPKWYGQWDGQNDKWMSALIFDGTTWQQCRMWNGTEFDESSVVYP